MAARWACLGYILTTSCVYASLAQYDFSQTSCRRGSTEDVAGGEAFFGDLNLNTSASCINGVGIEGSASSPGWPAATSIRNNTAFLEALEGPDVFPGFAVELWMTIRDSTCEQYDASGVYISNCQAPILAISSPAVNGGWCQDHVDMELLYRTEYQNFVTTFNGGNSYGDCLDYGTTYQLTTELLGYAFHFVFSVREATFNGREYGWFEWFVNGSKVSVQFSSALLPSTLLSYWHPDYILQLFDRRRVTDSTSYTPFEATIFRVALHNESFDNTKAFARYSAPIANSTPTVHDSSYYLMEDGESGDHYNEPEYYREPFPVAELQDIPLGVYDSDNDPTTPNYNNVYPKVFGYTLPIRGFLVNSSGANIVSTPFEVLEVGGIFSVKYRPPFNDYKHENSSYANVSFFANDGFSGNRSFTNATITIYVLSKNDPPVALNSSHVVYVGTKHNILPLQGTDIDIYDYAQGAFIAEPPPGGTLLQVCPRWLTTKLTVIGFRSFKFHSGFP